MDTSKHGFYIEDPYSFQGVRPRLYSEMSKRNRKLFRKAFPTFWDNLEKFEDKPLATPKEIRNGFLVFGGIILAIAVVTAFVT